MKLKICLWLAIYVVFSFPPWAWGATYYVRTDGNDTNCTGAADAAYPGSGSGVACAKKTIKVGIDLLYNAGDELHIGAGTYVETAQSVPDRSGAESQPIKIIGGYGGETIWDVNSLASTAVAGSMDYNVFQDITFRGADLSNRVLIRLYSGSDNNRITHCKFIDTAIVAQTTGLNTVIDTSIFEGTKFDVDGTYVIQTTTPGYIHAYKNIFRPSANHQQRGIGLNSTATSTLDSNVFDGATRAHIWLNAVQTLNLNNNIFISPGVGSSINGFVISSLGGTGAGSTVNDNNNLMLPNGWSTNRLIDTSFALTLNTTGRLSELPQFKEQRRLAYLFMTLDDAGTLADALSVAQKYYNPAGLKIGNCIQYQQVEASTVSHADAVAFINAGNDIYSHGYSHSQLNNLNALTITGPTANSKITITTDVTAAASENWTGSLVVLEGATVQDTLSFATYPTLASIRSRLNNRNYGSGAWSVAYPAGVTETGPLVKSTTLANIASQDVSTATTITYAATPYYFVEVTEAAAKLQAWIRSGATGRAAAYTVDYFIAGANLSNATVADVVAAAGLHGARQNPATSTATGYLSAMKPFDFVIKTDSDVRSGAGYKGSSNISFAAATKTITVTSALVKTTWGLDVGDTISVQWSTSNNNVLTIATISEAGGNTTITVNETLTDESNASALLICETKFKRSVAGFISQVASSGKGIEVMSHSLSSHYGYCELEHKWFAEVAGKSNYALRYGLNDTLTLMWSSGSDRDGNGFPATAGSKSSPDNTLTLGHAYGDVSDYRLRASSPCVNTGTNIPWTGVPNVTDFSGRKITDASGNIIAPGGVVDIGAYEFCPTLQNTGYGWKSKGFLRIK
ncbi:MAG: hypothetical protein VB050_03255 [Geobacteraceae bacterium]|nr:hypothetical protein [Geobacteraceae bacterium]